MKDCEAIAEIPIICLAAGLPLYHMTSRNVPENRMIFEEWEEMGYQMPSPGTYSLDLEHPKYFSLTKYHPFYYGVDPKGYKSVALCYQTIKDIILINPSNNYWKNMVDISKLENCLLNNPYLREGCIDGWLLVDEPPGDWREVFLVRPNEKVNDTPFEYTLSPSEIDSTKISYIWGDLELEIINQFTKYKGILNLSPWDCKIINIH